LAELSRNLTGVIRLSTEAAVRTQLRSDKARLEAIYREEAALIASIPADEHFLSEPAAAAFVGLAHESLQALRRAGVGPRHHAKRRRYRYRRSDLVAWMQEHRFG
jgi:hypothetical protein